MYGWLMGSPWHMPGEKHLFELNYITKMTANDDRVILTTTFKENKYIHVTQLGNVII